jgi:hypothetical protein
MCALFISILFTSDFPLWRLREEFGVSLRRFVGGSRVPAETGGSYFEEQEELGTNPELGDLRPGTGGFRKLRWADARRGKGRSAGLRIIHYHFKSDHQIWLMTVFDKDEASDLNPKETKALTTAIEGELAARAARRGRPRGSRRIR